MHSELIEIMRNQVSTIYRAVTGTAMPELQVYGAWIALTRRHSDAG